MEHGDLHALLDHLKAAHPELWAAPLPPEAEQRAMLMAYDEWAASKGDFRPSHRADRVASFLVNYRQS